jgi:hypothetical protein
MYHNSSFNTNNSTPLIPREQNYVIDRKLVSIHSEDRDITKYPFANKFDITLPQPLLNVQSMRLVQSTFPIDYYTFSNEYQNTKFRFTVQLGFIERKSYCVRIQEGTYTPCQLAQELTNVMNDAVNPGSEIFSVFYDVVGNQFWFGSTILVNYFSLDFDYKMEYSEIKCDQPIVWYNYARWGLPYYLGYNKEQYIATTDVMEINYIPKTRGGSAITQMIPLTQKVINIGGEKDIYMEVDKYNSYDELDPYTESNKNAYDNNAYNGKVNSAFAKIPLDPITGNQDSRNLLLINFVQYEPPIERINKLRFIFRFHDGRLVDFRGLEFNFTIEFNMLRNEILRSKNIRVPAMISL